MPPSTENIVLTVAGATLVVLFAILGVDPVIRAWKGPKWKRRLLIAGIALIALIGLGFFFRNAIKTGISNLWIHTCYIPAEIHEEVRKPEIVLQRLGERLKLPKQQLDAERIQPEVVRATLAAMQQDIRSVRESLSNSGESQGREQQRLQQLYNEASRLSEAAEARLREQP
jgi:hypothetical protein